MGGVQGTRRMSPRVERDLAKGRDGEDCLGSRNSKLSRS